MHIATVDVENRSFEDITKNLRAWNGVAIIEEDSGTLSKGAELQKKCKNYVKFTQKINNLKNGGKIDMWVHSIK